MLTSMNNLEQPGLRNYFLDEANYKNIKRPPGDISFLLVQRFGELIRKLWNPKNFKVGLAKNLKNTKIFKINLEIYGLDLKQVQCMDE